jgi:hypothetical protein
MRRADALRALAERLPEVWPEALAAAREIQDGRCPRPMSLRALAERLPEVWPEALAAAREIQETDDRADALRALAERLPAEHLPTALAAAREIQEARCPRPMSLRRPGRTSGQTATSGAPSFLA